mmetsp:Transcript_31075/g.69711  ORF Transcript_31075/g.69711 Transcript_31075/m.69711 type:complete len:694 (-) Transcript_31075:1581-3662(-)
MEDGAADEAAPSPGASGEGRSTPDAAEPDAGAPTTRRERLQRGIRHVAKELLGVSDMRQEQVDATTRCLDKSICDSKVLMVLRTGSGKSLVMQTAGIMMGGICLMIIPLLSLSADQLSKMRDIPQEEGMVDAINLDEFPNQVPGTKVFDGLIKRIQDMEEDTTSTIFLIASPQFMTRESSKDLMSAILNAHKRRLLRTVVIDEVHLYVQHSSFRTAIRMLKDTFFKIVFPEADPSGHPNFVLASATMTPRMVRSAEALTNVKLPSECRIWPGEEHFQQREIKMVYSVSNTYTGNLNQIVEMLKAEESRKRKRHEISGDSDLEIDSLSGEEDDGSARKRPCFVVFATFQSQVEESNNKLGEKLDAQQLTSDTIMVHGGQPRETKFEHMNAFTSREPFEHFSPRVLVTNGAGNTGIDHDLIVLVLRFGLVLNVITYIQERGRMARQPGSEGVIKSFYNIKSLIQNLHLIHGIRRSKDSPDNEEIIGLNSAIRKGNLRSTNKDDDGVSATLAKKYKLTAKEVEADRKEKERLQLEVLQLFCLNGGCQHSRLEIYSATGELKQGDSSSCDTQCPICSGEWKTVHIPVKKVEVIKWFKSRDFLNAMPLSTKNSTTGKDQPDSIVNLLWENESRLKLIFGKAKRSIRKYNVEAFMLSLVAAQIISWEVKGDTFQWIWNVDEDDKPCYGIDSHWRGIHTR